MPSSPSPRAASPTPAAVTSSAGSVAAAPAGAVAAAPAGALIATALVLCLACVTSACGVDTDARCDQSFLRYDNFGAPFILSWCRACHSADVPPGMRQDAPDHINFDTLDDIRTWSSRIRFAAGLTTTMPPAGGPSAAERTMLVEWLRCGAP